MLDLGSRPVVLDGGLSTALEEQGADLGGSLWTARLLGGEPERIAAAHRAFFESGAQVATTASYQASVEGLVAAGYDAVEARRLITRQRDDRARGARRARRRAAGAAGGGVGGPLRSLPGGRVGVHREVRRAVGAAARLPRPSSRAAGSSGARPAGGRDDPRRRRGRGAGRAARRDRGSRVVQLLGEGEPHERRPAPGGGVRRARRVPLARRRRRQLLRPGRRARRRQGSGGGHRAARRRLPQPRRQLGCRHQVLGVRRPDRPRPRAGLARCRCPHGRRLLRQRSGRHRRAGERRRSRPVGGRAVEAGHGHQVSTRARPGLARLDQREARLGRLLR